MFSVVTFLIGFPGIPKRLAGLGTF